MKTPILLTALLALSVGGHADGFLTRAKVVQSTPILETVYEQYEECRYETRVKRTRRPDNTGDKVLAGILGGAAGSQVGSGSGSDAAAGVGAVLGSELADGDGFTEGEIIGGIVGGIVGNQVGKGGGKTAATGAGALIGAIVGDNLQNGGQPAAASKRVKERICESKERAKKIITGYEVIYEYDGVRQTGVLSYSPGDYVDINVGVDLVEDRTRAYN